MLSHSKVSLWANVSGQTNTKAKEKGEKPELGAVTEDVEYEEMEAGGVP
jgi:hypothetical protein